MKSRTKLAVITVLLLLFTAGISFLLFLKSELPRWSQTPIELDHERLVTLPVKTPLRQLARELSRQGLIHQEFFFLLWIRFEGTYRHFQAGTYQFEGSVSPKDIQEKMTKGEIYQPLLFSFTVPEGAQLTTIAQKISELGLGSLDALEKLSKDPEFIKTYLGFEAPSLEGFLFPATYRFYEKKPDLKKVYETMIAEFFKRLPADYVESAQKKGISLYQAVTIASLIEKEAFQGEERTAISEVIWNRLKRQVPLGIDAALPYGILHYDGNIRMVHLRDASNRYNTRIHKGLPPSPIASPSLESLLAVLSPTDQGFEYYVLRPGPEKRHHFSKTLKEHNEHVRRLVQEQRKQ
ncbi:MAG: endolytic transglycosylase MltG [Oligoflexales bacterium]|nr:endolytic transglycosylase MltG [Oligoflexales bacterium]